MDQECHQIDAVWVKNTFFARSSFGERKTFLVEDKGDYPHLVGYHIPGDTWDRWQKPAFEKDEILRWFGEEFPEYQALYQPDKDAIQLDYGDRQAEQCIFFVIHLD